MACYSPILRAIYFSRNRITVLAVVRVNFPGTNAENGFMIIDFIMLLPDSELLKYILNMNNRLEFLRYLAAEASSYASSSI